MRIFPTMKRPTQKMPDLSNFEKSFPTSIGLFLSLVSRWLYVSFFIASFPCEKNSDNRGWINDTPISRLYISTMIICKNLLQKIGEKRKRLLLFFNLHNNIEIALLKKQIEFDLFWKNFLVRRVVHAICKNFLLLLLLWRRNYVSVA